MTKTSDWDHEEQQLRGKLEGELDIIRKRHAQDPPRDMLVAARAGVLPADEQARVSERLEQDPWSRAIVEGFEQSGADQDVDAAFEARLLANISQANRASTPARTYRRAFVATGGLALAATLLIGVLVSRDQGAPEAVSDSPSTAAPSSPAAAPRSAPAFQIAFTKPDVKWSPGALTWRGANSDQPFMADLTPALEAYREGDYARAGAAFDQLAVKYPQAVEVLFYQGVTSMLRDDFPGALAPLTAAERLKNVTFADDVAWLLGVAEQRSGQAAQARARLSQLCDRGGDHGPDACAAVAGLDEAAQRIPAKAR